MKNKAKRGEVWWISFDPALGGEIQKTRLAIIISNDTANTHLNRVQVVPVTPMSVNFTPLKRLKFNWLCANTSER